MDPITDEPGSAVSRVSGPSRVAGADEGIGWDELALAARNHALPLEALGYDVTPAGLHYVLTHYDIPATDADAWRLVVDGCIDSPLSLSLDDLKALPAVTHRVTLECAGNGRARLTPRPVSQPWQVGGVGTADWTGVPLRSLLERAGVAQHAAEVVFTGADHGVERGVEQDYQRSLPLPVAVGHDPPVLVAYAMNGQPLPVQHGHPLRLVVPGWYGMASVKWLRTITVTDTPFTGYQQTVAYTLRQTPEEPGTPVDRIEPRALLTPPGFPDFMTRTRMVHPGEVHVSGRAWSGRPPVTRVDFSDDGGHTWSPALLTPPDADRPWAWQRWDATWTATPGTHVLTARATDSAGHCQPLEQVWNRGGFTNNAVQLVPVYCE